MICLASHGTTVFDKMHINTSILTNILYRKLEWFVREKKLVDYFPLQGRLSTSINMICLACILVEYIKLLFLSIKLQNRFFCMQPYFTKMFSFL